MAIPVVSPRLSGGDDSDISLFPLPGVLLRGLQLGLNSPPAPFPSWGASGREPADSASKHQTERTKSKTTTWQTCQASL